MTVLTKALAFGAMGVLSASPALAVPGDILFSSDLDSTTGLTILSSSADTASAFGYDYSADGIPSAPGGPGTVGLKLEANIASPTGAEKILAVTNAPITAPAYRVTVDAWVNANGPFPGGGGGSTEFAGLSIGHDGTTADRNGGSFVYDGEGGSSRDYRMYKDTGEQFTSSGQYAVTSNNNSGPEFSVAFPGVAAPASQSQTGTPNNGSGGFQWMTIDAVVNTVAGTVTYTIASDDSGNSVVVGTLDANVGSSFATTGSVAIIYADLFSSVSDNSSLSFGVFDNFKVEEVAVPEPGTLALLGLGGLAMLRRRSA